MQEMATQKNGNRQLLFAAAILFSLCCCVPDAVWAAKQQKQQQKLRFGENGELKIVQVADMHYADGKSTPCLDVFPSQMATCSDLNTTAFVQRIIRAENPHLIVFTGTLHLLLLVLLWF
uniref:Calcineurin-like phosphoesterase family protein n=1 Tax=Rhizophora mucronata TaxID=61149 RepID=A0A2P2JRS4_RHIMU